MDNKLIDQWNDLFEFKLTVADLQKPKLNCSLLCNVLCSFMSAIHIDVEKVKTKIANGDERKFRIYLVKYIDHFVHVTCNKPNRFLYGHLIEPNPKKIYGILNLLVNYYLYFTMVRDEVVAKSSEKIEEYNKLRSQINRIQIQNEEFKMEAINKEEKIDEYNKSILKNKKLLEDLKVKNTSLMEAITDARQRLQSINAENIELKCQLDVLKPLIVSDIELETLMKNIKDAEDRVSSVSTIEQKVSEENQYYVNEINRLIAEIELLDSASLGSFAQGNYKNREELKRLNKQIEETKDEIENVAKQHVTCLNVLQSLQDQLLNKKADFKTIVMDCRTKEWSMESECKRLALSINELQQSIKTAEGELQNLQASQSFIITKGIQVIEQIANSSHNS